MIPFFVNQVLFGMDKHVFQIIKITIVRLELIGMIFIVLAIQILALKELNGMEIIVLQSRKNANQETIGLVRLVL